MPEPEPDPSQSSEYPPGISEAISDPTSSTISSISKPSATASPRRARPALRSPSPRHPWPQRGHQPVLLAHLGLDHGAAAASAAGATGSAGGASTWLRLYRPPPTHHHPLHTQTKVTAHQCNKDASCHTNYAVAACLDNNQATGPIFVSEWTPVPKWQDTKIGREMDYMSCVHVQSSPGGRPACPPISGLQVQLVPRLEHPCCRRSPARPEDAVGAQVVQVGRAERLRCQSSLY